MANFSCVASEKTFPQKMELSQNLWQNSLEILKHTPSQLQTLGTFYIKLFL